MRTLVRTPAAAQMQGSAADRSQALLVARSRSRDASPALEHEHKSAAAQRRDCCAPARAGAGTCSVSWLRVVQQTHRVLAHDGIPAIELTIWRSRWPGC